MVNNVLPQRRWRALGSRWLCLLALCARAAEAAAESGPTAGKDATFVPVIADWRTGLAIGGFDPVAYFAEGRAAAGLAAFESDIAHATWRFRCEANQAAFTAAPEAYRPRFGGYDPVILARGVATAGNPRVWLIHAQRLFFFYDDANRRLFAADPAAAVAAAEDGWRQARESVTP